MAGNSFFVKVKAAWHTECNNENPDEKYVTTSSYKSRGQINVKSMWLRFNQNYIDINYCVNWYLTSTITI